MKPFQFYASVTLSLACLVLSIWSVTLSNSNSRLEGEAQRLQAQINAGGQANQMLQSVLNDMAQLSSKNEKIKGVLAKNGITVNAPASTPASGK